jgi:hypothetical protein
LQYFWTEWLFFDGIKLGGAKGRRGVSIYNPSKEREPYYSVTTSKYAYSTTLQLPSHSFSNEAKFGRYTHIIKSKNRQKISQ